MIRADSHTHTAFSTDSQTPPELMIERAIALGLQQYSITDHMDYLYPCGEAGTFTFDVDLYIQTLEELRHRYRSQLDLRIGIELGLRNEADCKETVRAYYTSLLAKYPFDFVLGSTHVLEHQDPYFSSFWEGKTPAQGISAYFTSILDNTRYYDCFQIYGHLDYIIRYIPETVKAYDSATYQDLLDQVLTTLIGSGRGIECNTSGYKYGLGVPHPKLELLDRYHALGGELLTIGSDAHKPEHIAYDFKKAEELLTSLGYRYYTVFKNQKPEFVPL